jgi:hypothetical protein
MTQCQQNDYDVNKKTTMRSKWFYSHQKNGIEMTQITTELQLYDQNDCHYIKMSITSSKWPPLHQNDCHYIKMTVITSKWLSLHHNDCHYIKMKIENECYKMPYMTSVFRFRFRRMSRPSARRKSEPAKNNFHSGKIQKLLISRAGNPHWRGKISTFDLLVLTS